MLFSFESCYDQLEYFKLSYAEVILREYLCKDMIRLIMKQFLFMEDISFNDDGTCCYEDTLFLNGFNRRKIIRHGNHNDKEELLLTYIYYKKVKISFLCRTIVIKAKNDKISICGLKNHNVLSDLYEERDIIGNDDNDDVAYACAKLLARFIREFVYHYGFNNDYMKIRTFMFRKTRQRTNLTVDKFHHNLIPMLKRDLYHQFNLTLH